MRLSYTFAQMHGIDIKALAAALLDGDRVSLARAITLVESSLDRHRKLAAMLLQEVAEHAGNAQRIGITGVPGVGKSTFIETYGMMLADRGKKVAVLAVDPSSDIGKGSILGDRSRMERLSAHPNVFIRPTPSGGSLGGVARRTKETVTLCEAAGHDIVIIETVGVGQSETAVHALVDVFVLLVLASAGDELQGIKRGIMEMADIVIVNKDDGNNAHNTAIAKAAYQHALHLFPAKQNGWTVPVLSCSALEGRGLTEVAEKLDEFFRHVTSNGHLQLHRREQNVLWMEKVIQEELLQRFMARPEVVARLSELRTAVLDGLLSPFEAAKQLIDLPVNGC
jgi:LAO/AO transport system kinase